MSQRNISSLYSRVFISALCLLPILAMEAPRFLGFAPAVIALMAVLAYRVSFKEWPKFSRMALGCALAVSTLIALSALWAIDPEFALKRAIKVSVVLLSGAALFSLSQNMDRASVLRFQCFFPIAILLSGLLCIIELYSQRALYYMFMDVPPDISLSNLSPLNRAVVVFILVLPIALYCAAFGDFWKKHVRGRRFLLLALGLCTAAILYKTESQSVQLALAVGLVGFFVFPVKSPKAWGALGIFLSVLVLSTPWLAQFLFTHFSALALENSWLRDGWAANRMEIWDMIARRSLEQPWIGHGVEATRAIKDFDMAGLYHPVSEVLHPHNFALQIWIEFGVLGAALTSAFFAVLIHRMYKVKGVVARFILATFLIFVSISATGYGMWQGWWLGLLVLLFSYSVLAQEKSEA